MVKGTKLYVAFQNISINIWYTSYFAFDITFSSFMDQKCELNKTLYKKCRVSCNCLYMLLLISYQTSYENKANKINLDKNYKFIKFYRLCDKCAFLSHLFRQAYQSLQL